MLCVVDIYGKYAWVVHLTDKKAYYNYNAFQKILDGSNCNGFIKLWVNKGSEFCSRSMKSWL